MINELSGCSQPALQQTWIWPPGSLPHPLQHHFPYVFQTSSLWSYELLTVFHGNQWEWKVLQCSAPCWFDHKKWTTYLLYLKYNYSVSMNRKSALHLFYHRNNRHRKYLENEEHTCVWAYNKASLYIIVYYKSFQRWQAVFQLHVTTAWCI